MGHLVLLDLDKTLLACNSASLWIRREHRLGHITTWQLMQPIGWLTLYHLGKADVSIFLHKAAEWVTGDLESDLHARTEAFWMETIQHSVRPEVHAVLEQHRQQGDTLALLTASSNYLSELVAKQLGVEHVLCNRMVVEDEVLTGAMHTPLCFGGDKAISPTIVRRFGVGLETGYFYTDSYSDLPVLEQVVHPKVVCPDPRLERTAQQRGWDILRWSE